MQPPCNCLPFNYVGRVSNHSLFYTLNSDCDFYFLFPFSLSNAKILDSNAFNLYHYISDEFHVQLIV